MWQTVPERRTGSSDQLEQWSNALGHSAVPDGATGWLLTGPGVVRI